MHENHLQKTHILTEVADQRPAKSTKISFPTGTLPHTPSKQITHPAPTQTNRQTGKGLHKASWLGNINIESLLKQ